MSEQPGAAGESGSPTPKRATTRRRASAARRTTTTTRKKATAKAGTAASAAKRRGRPPGSRNKRTTTRATRAPRAAASTNPADAMSKRISDLINENRALKSRVSELEAGWKKIEKALGSEVQKARRTVKRTTRSAAKKVTAAINAVTP